uniref:Uncharacterized protein n=1 Tax=Candidatus Kentrum sp. SD TaxID=2126332 RepID=A0A451BM12_9GAMM|nr:MAG: hypothetical protein BECKSD772D_GA0070982_104326 [Candidatus Kentron sp. SD]
MDPSPTKPKPNIGPAKYQSDEAGTKDFHSNRFPLPFHFAGFIFAGKDEARATENGIRSTKDETSIMGSEARIETPYVARDEHRHAGR